MAKAIPLDPAVASRFSDWLHQRVIDDATGAPLSQISTNPSGTFWLGRLSSEQAVLEDDIDSRGNRLDPCSMGLRFRPSNGPPWAFVVSVRATIWQTEDQAVTWQKCEYLSESIPVEVPLKRFRGSFGETQLTSTIERITGKHGLSARIDVEASTGRGGAELIVTLVNTSPKDSKDFRDTHLYECSLVVSNCGYQPFALESLPDSFRYDRTVPAYGMNCGTRAQDGNLKTIDDPCFTRFRSVYWPVGEPEPAFTFQALAADPMPLAETLLASLTKWGQYHWSDAHLLSRRGNEHWSEGMYAQAKKGAKAFWDECNQISTGIDALKNDPNMLRAFKLMNASMLLSAHGKYVAWRPFQLGFLLANLAGILTYDRDCETADIVWFATGGGKTETYLGLLITSVFFDRMTGKLHGITAWSRFPLRMLSLQQTQRFANALAAAEIVRGKEQIEGSPFSLGFFVGQGATPNSLKPEPKAGDPDPDDDEMPKGYRLLDACPFCRETSIEMAFDHKDWKLEHRCTNKDCPWPERGLPIYIVDDEIYRFLPTVIVGTLDKAANIGMQASMRGFVGAPWGLCSKTGHGYVYAERSTRKHGCLVPGCKGERSALPQDAKLFGPSFRLQDELHLLRDSLGAVDSHYEALLDSLQQELTGTRPKILGSSATLAGYEKQIDVLYRRKARVFPQPPPEAHSGFWSSDTNERMRKFIAIAPRGVTLEHAVDRILSVLQRAIRELQANPTEVCATIGIDQNHAEALVSLYGTDVVYGNSLRDLDAVERSIDGQQILVSGQLNRSSLTGRTDFDEVRKTLARLESPEAGFQERIHVVTASSMMSHGVDIDRLNVMVMIGIPLGTSEFIQTTARVGRTWPGLVFVLHKIGRERDAGVFGAFEKFVEHGDRFVEPIPITRHSRRVLERTLPGLVNARILHVHEPVAKMALTTPQRLKNLKTSGAFDLATETDSIKSMLAIRGGIDSPLTEELDEWFARYSRLLDDPPPGARFISDIYPSHLGPMRSLRDVEESVPIFGRDDE